MTPTPLGPLDYLGGVANAVFIACVIFSGVRSWLIGRAIRLTVEDLVSQAIRTGTNEDHEKLLAGLPLGYKVFFNEKCDDAESGAPKSSQLSIPYYEVPGLTNVIPFFTNKNNAQLRKPYAAMTWLKALALVINTPSANGLTIGNAGDGYVAIDKQKARSVLNMRASREYEATHYL